MRADRCSLYSRLLASFSLSISFFFYFLEEGGGGLLLVSSKSMSVICVRVSLVNHTTCACQDRDEAIWSQRLIPSVRVYFFVGNGHGHWGGLVCVV